MRIHHVLVLVALPLCGLMLGFAQSALPPPDLVITNARLIDGTGAVHDRVVLTIRENRIQSIVQGELDEKTPPLPYDLTAPLESRIIKITG